MSDNIYLGNPNLKKANTPHEFTEEQVIEFIRCKNDPVYFARNYIKIVSLDYGLVNFDMYPFQEKLIQNFHDNRFNICKCHDRLVVYNVYIISFTLCCFMTM